MNYKSWILRALSGIVYVGLIVGCIFWGTIPFSVLAAILGVIAVIEFQKVCEGITETSLPPLFLDAAGVVFLAFGWTLFPLLGWIVVYLCRMILELYTRNERPIRSMAVSLMTQIYIGLPLCLMTFIGREIGMHFLLAIFLLIWINDTGAFIIGSLFGRHRLFERISPKKSWEGFFGGLCFNLLAAWLFCIGGGHFWEVKWNVITWLIFAAVVTIFSTWGDLIESLMKRSLKIKDSGHLIPGHGGILDRIDSLLLVMPASFLFLLTYFIFFHHLLP
ncbi:MAG: phosphatidate cytidylyltransferase [Muribaculaceae bacterium]|nr:phosphatidate cytidylyltransferase [Muribaculaceae bacterium]